MASNGLLNFQGTNKATFVGASSNIALDVVNSSLGIGITGTDPPSSNLYITGNAYVTSDISVGGVLNMGVVNVAARHTLEAITALGASTPSTLTLTNTGTSLVASGDVTVDTNTFHVDTTNNRVGVGTTTPKATLHNTGDFFIAANNANWESITGKGLHIRYSTDGGQDATYIQSSTRTASPMTYHPIHMYGSKFSFSEGKIGIREQDPDAWLHNNGDFFIAANSDNWTATTGKGLYIRYSTTGGQDATYIQSITRSASPTVYHPMHIYGSKFSFNQGNVGVGIQDPLYPLDVSGHATTGPPSGVWGYYVAATEVTTVGSPYNSYNQNISLRVSQGIIAQKFQTYSDRRIKKNITQIEDDEALIKLRNLQPCKYNYIDNVKGGSRDVYGFIAQEVGSILPDAVGTHTNCIPNIYELANVFGSNVITFTNFNTTNLESNAMVLKVYDTQNKQHLINIAEIVDEHTIRVEEDLSEWTDSIDETGNVVYGNQLFVYGQEVDDFFHLDKNVIWTVATAALQEVDRQLQAEKEKVRILEDHLTRFTAQVTARLAALESKK